MRDGMGQVNTPYSFIKTSGSFFVLGELFTSLELPFDQATTKHCGSCSCVYWYLPNQAIVEPYLLDARKCIAYLTIEFQGIIPEELRRGIGNRVFGCDDCQLICPWNSFAKPHQLMILTRVMVWMTFN